MIEALWFVVIVVVYNIARFVIYKAFYATTKAILLHWKLIHARMNLNIHFTVFKLIDSHINGVLGGYLQKQAGSPGEANQLTKPTKSVLR